MFSGIGYEIMVKSLLRTILATLRALLLTGLVVLIVPVLLLGSWVPGYGAWWRQRVRRLWIRMILVTLGIRIHWEVRIPDFPAIYVGNHRAYIDPLLLMRDVLAVPVAKKEMASWPLIGFAARLSGIFFVDRESSKDRQRTLHKITAEVRRGGSILLFPEGTTHAGHEVLPFRKGVFRVAAEEQVHMVPFALDFDDPADYWIGKDTFAAHFFRRFGHWRTRVHVAVGPDLFDPDGEAMRLHCMEWINAKLAEFRAGEPARTLERSKAGVGA